ncbi:MAG TPA: osmotically inducible protein OsmC [Elusimicrobia bacterium]|nr:osmotically inducible protein OsmC [Elusimicrobiota bacterium]
MAVEVEVVYQGELVCKAVHGPSKALMLTEAPADNGGKGEQFSPTDLVGTALGSCVLTIMGLVAKRGGLDISGARAKVVKEMASAPLRRIAHLACTVTMPARGFTEEQKQKLVRGAELCPVKQSLHPDVKVEIEYVWS